MKAKFQKIKKSVLKQIDTPQFKGRLMVAFGIGHSTACDWIEKNSVKLTNPTVLELIAEETGLSNEQLLEKEKS